MKDAFKVRITGAQFGSYWYADKIGEVFKVVNYGGVDYRCQGGKIEGEPAEDFCIHKSDCEIVEDTMEEYTDSKGQTWEQLRPITLNALREAGAEDGDVDALFNSSFFSTHYSPTKRLGYAFELDTIIDYASSCNDKLQWLVDNTQWRKEGDKFSGFIRRVEKKYEVKLGDRYHCFGGWHRLYKLPKSNVINLLNEDGRSHGEGVAVKNMDGISIKDFKEIIYSIGDWQAVYATRVPYNRQ